MLPNLECEPKFGRATSRDLVVLQTLTTEIILKLFYIAKFEIN